jgi:uncharacterized membrane protein
MKLKDLPWIPFAFLAIAIGLYPLTYYLVDMHDKGLLQTKPKELVNNTLWHTAFYIHITFGGVALLTGWSQFSQKLRNRYLNTHRTLGKIYVIAVFLSSCAGLFIAFFSTGGIICVLGFGFLALSWLFTIIKAYTSIRRLDISEHRRWMIRNYALTFAAVTLRIWLPMGQNLMHMDFFLIYRIVSWMAWVPNLIVAELLFIRKRRTVVQNKEGALA